jgi:Nif-specific regulatory protein
MIDSPNLLAPPDAWLPLLFEASRILDRHANLAEALPALLRSVEAGGLLHEGAAALAVPESQQGGHPPTEGGSLQLVSASSLTPYPAGSRIAMGSGAFGKVLEAGRSVEGRDELGTWVAAPTIIHDSVVAILGFRLGDEDDTASRRSLLEALAVLLGEALVLRRLIAAGAGPVEEIAAPGRATDGGDGFASAGAGGRAGGASERLEAKPRKQAADPLAVLDSIEDQQGLHGLLGPSAAMMEVRNLIARVGPTDSTVLVTGESGTGKELAARALHASSARAKGPFVAVNCAALPESLIESELFGHERGSFTGAEARRRGRFEMAAGGTLFFDEVGELGLGVQAKLLRVLQERCFERVGGTELLRADVRVIAATNRELEAEVAAGRFREDLWWRLNVFPLRMPPLRERGGDVVILADRFAETLGLRLGKAVLRISTPALDLLTSYHWPGNVRELENAIERAVVLSTDGVIHAWHLPPSLQSAASTGTGPVSTLDATLARIERELLVEALKMNSGNASAAARQLGITDRRIGLALHKYAIDWRRFRTKK